MKNFYTSLQRIAQGDSLIIKWPFIDKLSAPLSLSLCDVSVELRQHGTTKYTFEPEEVVKENGLLTVYVTGPVTALLRKALVTVRVKIKANVDEESIAMTEAINTFARQLFEVVSHPAQHGTAYSRVSKTAFAVYNTGWTGITTEDDKVITTEDGKIIII